jgi:hypothetical protein
MTHGGETWIFDVDGCLVDALTGRTLRPGAHVLLTHLRRQGRTVLWWSAGGDVYAEQRANDLGVAALIGGFHSKEGRDANGRYGVGHLPAAPRRVFVDDEPGELPAHEEVLAVSHYLDRNPHDRGLLPVMRRAGCAWEDS